MSLSNACQPTHSDARPQQTGRLALLPDEVLRTVFEMASDVDERFWVVMRRKVDRIRLVCSRLADIVDGMGTDLHARTFTAMLVWIAYHTAHPDRARHVRRLSVELHEPPKPRLGTQDILEAIFRTYKHLTHLSVSANFADPMPLPSRLHHGSLSCVRLCSKVELDDEEGDRILELAPMHLTVLQAISAAWPQLRSLDLSFDILRGQHEAQSRVAPHHLRRLSLHCSQIYEIPSTVLSMFSPDSFLDLYTLSHTWPDHGLPVAAAVRRYEGLGRNLAAVFATFPNIEDLIVYGTSYQFQTDDVDFPGLENASRLRMLRLDSHPSLDFQRLAKLLQRIARGRYFKKGFVVDLSDGHAIRDGAENARVVSEAAKHGIKLILN